MLLCHTVIQAAVVGAEAPYVEDVGFCKYTVHRYASACAFKQFLWDQLESVA